MMTRRTWLIAVVLLLASVGTASAECAWVLWGQYLSAEKEWEPVEAVSSRKECDAFQGRLLRGFQDSGWKRTHDSPTPLKSPDGKLHLLAVKCLPDTVDPRGPKGK